MSGIGRIAVLGAAAFFTSLLLAGVLPESSAADARMPRADIPRSALFDPADNDSEPADNDADGNTSNVAGRRNSVTANSPTKNVGKQNKSSNNQGGQLNFQYAMCKRKTNCSIPQRSVTSASPKSGSRA